jgi:LacI family transcriptional regulator
MTRRRVAISIDLEWAYKSHMETFAGIMRHAEMSGDWECVMDDFFEDSLRRRRGQPLPYDGAVGRITLAQARAAHRVGIPVVNVWFGSPAKNLPSVLHDSEAMGRMRADHLLELGVRNFATLRIPYDVSSEVQADAFESRVRAEGYPCVTGSLDMEATDLKASGNLVFDRRKTQNALARWLDRWNPPIGVSINTDHLGRKVAQMCARRGWRIPDQVALVAGHNEEIICERPAPSITSVEVGYDRIGYRAAVLLDRLMAGETIPTDELHQKISPRNLVPRASTDFLAVDDPLVASAMLYISKHFEKPITIDNVAEAANTSRATLNRRFSEHLRRSVNQEIRRQRLSRARRALVSSNEPIAAIARRCGYPWPEQFSRAFRSEHNMTPAEYRRSKR